jgi:excisionase family DNA binding protein
MKTWLTVSEAAEYAAVSRDTIYTACERHEIRHARVGGRRAIRVKPEWVDAWLERHIHGGENSRGTGHCAPASAYSDVSAHDAS